MKDACCKFYERKKMWINKSILERKQIVVIDIAKTNFNFHFYKLNITIFF